MLYFTYVIIIMLLETYFYSPTEKPTRCGDQVQKVKSCWNSPATKIRKSIKKPITKNLDSFKINTCINR